MITHLILLNKTNHYKNISTSFPFKKKKKRKKEAYPKKKSGLSAFPF